MLQIASIPHQGSIGTNVLFVQQQLKHYGEDPGSLDQIWGAKTTLALKKFQKKQGLTQTGTLGPKTLKALGIEVTPLHPMGGAAITHPFRGRKENRELHPTLRLLMEQKIFKNGIIPEPFKNQHVQTMAIYTARGLAELGIREEGGANKGDEVGLIQDIIGRYEEDGTGDAWCMSTMQCLVAFIEDFLQVESPVFSSEGCVETWNRCEKIAGLTTKHCEEGTIYIGEHQKKKGTGHTGLVLRDFGTDSMETFEGNRSNRAYIAPHSKTQEGDLKTLGFVRIFPNNKVPQ